MGLGPLRLTCHGEGRLVLKAPIKCLGGRRADNRSLSPRTNESGRAGCGSSSGVERPGPRAFSFPFVRISVRVNRHFYLKELERMWMQL